MGSGGFELLDRENEESGSSNLNYRLLVYIARKFV